MPIDDPWFDGESYLPDPDEEGRKAYERRKMSHNTDLVRLIYRSSSTNNLLWFALPKGEFQRLVNQQYRVFDGFRVVIHNTDGGVAVSNMPIAVQELYDAENLYFEIPTQRPGKASRASVAGMFGRAAGEVWNDVRARIDQPGGGWPNADALVEARYKTNIQSTTDTTQENTPMKVSPSTTTVHANFTVAALEVKEGWVGQVIFADEIVWQSEPLVDDFDPETKIYGDKSLQAAKDKVTRVVTALFASE